MFFYVHSGAVEKSKLEARMQGFASSEQMLEDGSIKVTINTGGSA